MVLINNLTVKIKNQLLLDSVSCSLQPGKITSFIGKSGAGKTTLLKSLVGLIPTTEGQITINGKQLNRLTARQRSEEIGYVFQDFNLFPHFTVLQNCIDPLIVHEVARAQAQNQASTLLQQLNIQEFINKYPAELSGGQKQRVAIARCLGLKPRILLLDEPSASLDPRNTDVLVSIVQSLASSGLTIGVSSQDMNFVRKIFDCVYYIESGQIIEFCDDITKLDQYPAIQRFI